MESLPGLHKEVARLQAELERLRREGEEERRRAAGQEVHYRCGNAGTECGQLSTLGLGSRS